MYVCAPHAFLVLQGSEEGVRFPGIAVTVVSHLGNAGN